MIEPQYRSVDKFDRALGSLVRVPDTTHTKPSTIVVETPLLGAQTFIVQTYRQREVGDSIFLQYVDGDGNYRLVIPPEVADTIARQRDSLTTKVRRKVGKASAAARKARGEAPAFLKGNSHKNTKGSAP